MKKNKLEKFIAANIVMIIILLCFFVAGAVVYDKFNYAIKQNSLEKTQLQDKIAKQMEEVETNKKIQQSKIEELEGTIAVQNNKITQHEKIISEKQRKENTIADCIKTWSPFVARITCVFKYVNSNERYAVQQGSGVALGREAYLNNDDQSFIFLTNKHIFLDYKNRKATYCVARLPYTLEYIIYRDLFRVHQKVDIGYLTVTLPSHIEKNEVLFARMMSKHNYCKSNSIFVGDSIVILGYPSYGPKYYYGQQPTATEGIISGRDGNYYTTSAKIEKGNSGGIAIHIENNCLLGIPSAVKIGAYENLGYILDISR